MKHGGVAVGEGAPAISAQIDERVLTLLPKVYTVHDLIRQVKERCAARAGPTQARPGGAQIVNGSVRTGAIHAPVHRYPMGGDL
jgi:hypothetical protein